MATERPAFPPKRASYALALPLVLVRRDDGIVNSGIAEMNNGNPKLSAEAASAR